MIKSLNIEFGAKVLLALLYFFGVLGMLSPFKDYFLFLTPLNLLITSIILIYFHPIKGNKFYSVTALIMILGFVIEIIGVNTGYPFGNYIYGSPLGPKLLGTPFIIGVNWFIMTYCGAMVFRKVSRYKFANALMAGVAITLLDFIMEPVAIHLDFWTWEDGHVPLQNYITWGICISIFSLLLYRIDDGTKNPITNWVLGAQIFFFLGILIGINV